MFILALFVVFERRHGEPVQLARKGEQGCRAPGTAGTRPGQPQGATADPPQALDGTITSPKPKGPRRKNR